MQYNFTQMIKNIQTSIIVLAVIFSWNSAFSMINKTSLPLDGKSVTQANFSQANTIYEISKDVYITGDINLPQNSILSFTGGTIHGGNLIGNNTQIFAPEYKIFDNVTLSGTFSNSDISASWFGALSDGITDDSQAIQQAINNAGKSCVLLNNATYLINKSIQINRSYTRLKSNGCMKTSIDIPVLELNACDVDIDIHEIKYEPSTNSENIKPINYKGTGILFSGNVYNSNIKVHNIIKLKKGLDFSPIASNNKFKYAGSQYNKISWQLIDAYYCIYFNLLKDKKYENKLWVNENQFFGGRLSGKYGIYVERPTTSNYSPKYDWINGNVFYSIGFEGIDFPISMNHAAYNSFHDLRMSESIYNDIWIDLKECRYINLDIKSIVPYSKIKMDDCVQIDLSRCFTDNGLGYNSGFNKIYTTDYSQNQNENFTVSRDLNSCNILQSLYFDKNITPKRTYNFNDLFVQTYDGEMVLSNICQITMFDNINLVIDFANSIYKMRPDMTLKISLSGNSYIDFINGSKKISSITKSGTYRITFDRDNNIYIIPL